MPVSLDDYYGGGVELSTGVDLDLWYARGRKLQAVTATAGGLTVTLPPAASRAFQEDEGKAALCVLNVPGGNAFTLESVEGNISSVFPANAMAILNRVRRISDGAWVFALDARLPL